MKPLFVSLGVSALACLGVVAVSQTRSMKVGDPVSPLVPGKRSPEAAMQQARALMGAYQVSGKDWSRVDRKLLNLPDQKLVEDASRRQANAFMPFGLNAFYKGRIAFACDTYVTQNLTYEGGDLVKSSPEGYWIVGYESGEVKQVPVSQVRYFYRKSKVPGGEEWRATSSRE